MAHEKSIYIKGARVHNLKNIEVEIPHEKLVVVTGLSGSGKSTLAFDTIFAEGQRRYVESLSAYARQFLGKISKPDVDIITGIAPAIAIEQKVNTRNPRSTVGTTTEIYDYLKLLYARIGHTFSPVSGQEVRCYSVDDVAAYIQQQGEGGRVVIAAPLTLGRGQGIIEKLTLLLSDGLMRVWTKGETRLIEDILPQVDEKTRAEEILVVIDRARIAADDDTQTRMRDSVARAFSYGEGICTVITDKGATEFSSRFEADGIQFEHPSEHLFSFNNPLGACPRCEGYGKVIGIDEDLVIPDKSKTIYEDAVACWRGETMRKWKEQLVENAYKFDFPIHTPFHELTQEQKRLLWRGNEYFHGLDDFFAYIDSERRKIQFRVMKARYTGKTTCPECGGSRLRREALYVKVGGKTVADLVVMPVDELIAFFAGLELDGHDTKTAARILVEIRNRLQYLADVGLGYLTLDRSAATLSTGERQRMQLARAVRNRTTGVLYVLDEPSIGLHPANIVGLTGVMHDLVADGNSVILVDHDTQILKESDWIIEMGPEAGAKGGRVIAQGTVSAVAEDPASQIGPFLSGAPEAPLRPRAGKADMFAQGVIHLATTQIHTVKPLAVTIPKGRLTVVTGVSGSGKTTMVLESLIPALEAGISGHALPPHIRSVSAEGIAHVKLIDATPIGINVRSTVATYAGVHDELRKLYARSPDAKARGCKAGDFSYNTGSLRCPGCDGTGVVSLDVQFLPDVNIPCPDCRGSRYARAAYDIRLTNRAGQSASLPELMDMDVNTALPFCADRKTVSQKLQVLQQLGLGYLTLGEETPSLSGGEAQRLKLASEIGRIQTDSVFVFDEPSIGLHPLDVRVLLGVFQALLDHGATVIVIEHDLDVIRSADYVIDMGPGGGDAGGRIVAAGTPEEIRQDPDSITGRYL